METSSRMRRCLRRNYRGSDHFGAAANYDDQKPRLEEVNAISPSKASLLVAEAISMEDVNEDYEQETSNSEGRVDDTRQHGEIQNQQSATAEQPLQTSKESENPLLAADPDPTTLHSPSAVAPGYIPSEHDERIVLELPSSMVRPLKVLRGMLQVSSDYLVYYVHFLKYFSNNKIYCKINAIQFHFNISSKQLLLVCLTSFQKIFSSLF